MGSLCRALKETNTHDTHIFFIQTLQQKEMTCITHTHVHWCWGCALGHPLVLGGLWGTRWCSRAPAGALRGTSWDHCHCWGIAQDCRCHSWWGAARTATTDGCSSGPGVSHTCQLQKAWTPWKVRIRDFPDLCDRRAALLMGLPV